MTVMIVFLSSYQSWIDNEVALALCTQAYTPKASGPSRAPPGPGATEYIDYCLLHTNCRGSQARTHVVAVAVALGFWISYADATLYTARVHIPMN